MGRSIRFAIVGAGIGGLSLAIALQRKGFQVIVFESAPSIKPLGAGLALAVNAVQALMEIGISEDVVKAGSLLKKIRIKDDRGNVLSETDSEKISHKYNVVSNFTIHRADLHKVLLHHVAKDTLQLGKLCVDFIQTSAGVRLIFKDGSFHETDYVIACDGIHSVFRKKLVPKSLPRYAGYTCWRAVIHNVPSSLDVSETSETWGKGSRFGIVPLGAGRLYWFACINAKQNDPVMRSYGVNDLYNYFKNFHDPIPEILQHTENHQLIWNDIVDIKPLRQFAFGNALLIGDAAHATTPNMGQGACMAIEDAAILANTIANSYPVEDAFRVFEHKRIKRTTTIVNNSWKLGRVAQWENSLLVKLRNSLLRLTPPSIAEKQVKFLQEVKFQ